MFLCATTHKYWSSTLFSFLDFKNILKLTKWPLWHFSSHEELCGQTEESTPALWDLSSQAARGVWVTCSMKVEQHMAQANWWAKNMLCNSWLSWATSGVSWRMHRDSWATRGTSSAACAAIGDWAEQQVSEAGMLRNSWLSWATSGASWRMRRDSWAPRGEGKMVDLGGYVIILVETSDKRVKLYGK